MIANYVHITVLSQAVISEANTVSVQTDFFDKIFPNILPFGFVFLLYYLLRSKKVSPVILIVGTFVLAILLSFLGIL